MDLLPLFTAAQARTFATASPTRQAAVALAAHRQLKRAVSELPLAVETVLVQRQADMLPSLAVERQAASDRRLVLDVDDAIWHDTEGAGGHRLARLKGTRRKVRWLADRADVVVAGNELLAEFLGQYSNAVRVIPSLVDVALIAKRVHREADAIVFGWIGSSSTVPFLSALAPALAGAARQLAPTPVELHAVGGSVQAIPGVAVRAVPWSEDNQDRALSRMDIGLMPVPDSPFTRGKCAYKALQYMAAGVPVVADDVGVAAQVVGDRAAGLIARSRDDWIEALTSLGGDVKLRTRLGDEGRRRVTAHYSYERWLPELADVLVGH